MSDDYLNDPEFRILIEQFLNHLQESIPDIEKDIEQKDMDALRKFGHNLKGSGGGYGYADLSELGQILEFSARDNEYDTFVQTFAKYKALLDEKIKSFRQ